MDFETANCKLNISKCKEKESLYIDRPLKPNVEVESLQQLVSELHQVFSSDYVNVEYVTQLMLNYKSNPKDWKKYAKFDRFRYTRNLVDAGNGLFNIMVLCWGPGHASAIHDHADSHCFMKMLRGDLEEVRYDWPEHSKPAILKEKVSNNNQCPKCAILIQTAEQNISENRQTTCDSCQVDSSSDNCHEDDYDEADNMEELSRSRLEENDVCYINDTMGLHRVENPSHVDGAVSLHLYCPPFDSCRVFDARTGRPTRANVTFWSINGKKRSKITEEN